MHQKSEKEKRRTVWTHSGASLRDRDLSQLPENSLPNTQRPMRRLHVKILEVKSRLSGPGGEVEEVWMWEGRKKERERIVSSSDPIDNSSCSSSMT